GETALETRVDGEAVAGQADCRGQAGGQRQLSVTAGYVHQAGGKPGDAGGPGAVLRTVLVQSAVGRAVAVRRGRRRRGLARVDEHIAAAGRVVQQEEAAAAEAGAD